MAKDSGIYSETQSKTRKIRTTAPRYKGSLERYPLDFTHRGFLGRPAWTISAQKHLPSTLPGMDRIGGLREDSYRVSKGSERTRRYRPERRFYRWNICSGKKRGDGVGKTKRGKGTKIMGITDARGIPIAVNATSSSPHEITLVD
ncbi:MAG: hypothetical protein PVH77_04625, partial [Phycisphaerales bacterium]